MLFKDAPGTSPDPSRWGPLPWTMSHGVARQPRTEENTTKGRGQCFLFPLGEENFPLAESGQKTDMVPKLRQRLEKIGVEVAERKETQEN